MGKKISFPWRCAHPKRQGNENDDEEGNGTQQKKSDTPPVPYAQRLRTFLS
jgi:hypothetical protein